MLNLERLRVLRAVADRGSVNAAAESLHVTNSAISQQLAKLEQEVGQPLIERHGRGVRLTDAATALVVHTARVLSMLEQAEAELDAQRTAVVGRLTIAAVPTTARGLGPRALRHLCDLYPRLEVTLHEQEPGQSIPLLVRGDLDLVVAPDWTNAPLALPVGLSRAPLMDDLADIALPVGHPLASRTAISLDELADARWVAWEAGSICHDWLLHTLRSRGHEPLITHTAREHSTQLALVAAGFGAAVVPRLGREPLPDGVRMVAVEPALRRRIYALWREETSKRRGISAAVEAFQHAASGVTKLPSTPMKQRKRAERAAGDGIQTPSRGRAKTVRSNRRVGTVSR